MRPRKIIVSGCHMGKAGSCPYVRTYDKGECGCSWKYGKLPDDDYKFPEWCPLPIDGPAEKPEVK